MFPFDDIIMTQMGNTWTKVDHDLWHIILSINDRELPEKLFDDIIFLYMFKQKDCGNDMFIYSHQGLVFLNY